MCTNASGEISEKEDRNIRRCSKRFSDHCVEDEEKEKKENEASYLSVH